MKSSLSYAKKGCPAPPATAADVIARLARRVERIVFLSSPHQTPHPFFQQPNSLANLHRDIDRLVTNSARASTIIRRGMFASNSIFWWASQIQTGDVVRWPYGAVETAPIDDRDIAAVAVRALAEEGHAGRDYVITGPESLSHETQVRAIGNIGRNVAGRVGRCRRHSGIRDLDGVGHYGNTGAHLRRMGRRARRRLQGPDAQPESLSGDYDLHVRGIRLYAP